MKAPPPSSWKFAIGTSAPSPQVLAMAMLGGAGLTAAGVSYSNIDGTDGKSDDTNNTSRITPPQYLARSKTGILSQPTRIPVIGPSSGSMLATSSSILATSDASAERSASMAAAARLSHKPSPFSVSVDAKENGNGNGAEDTTHDHDDVPGRPRTKHLNFTSREAAHNLNKVNSNNYTDNNSAKNADINNRKQPTPPTTHNENEDSYPTFTPYHNSLLKKYLTPKVWSKLSHLETSLGTTIEDVIRAGIALPLGANPPRGVGVLAGDAECYEAFRELLDPIIFEYHGIKNYEEWVDPELPMEGHFGQKGVANEKNNNKSSSTAALRSSEDDYGVMKSSGADEDSDENDDSSFLLDEEDDAFVEYVALPSSAQSNNNTNSQSQSSSAGTGSIARNTTTIASKRKASLRRHSTIINNPRLVTNREADPEGKYIVSTRIRVARSLDGVKFPTTMSRSDRRKVQSLICDCTQNSSGPTMGYNNGTYQPLLKMTNDQDLDLIERHILFDNPNEWTIAAGLGRDWPDGRALYANVVDLNDQTPDFMIWVNEEDHLRIMCLRSGGDIQGVFTTLMNGVRELERELAKRDWHFAYDSRLGYLTSCPTNVGTTMRASVHVKLTNLGRLPGFVELVERLKLEVRGKYGETDRRYTGVFDISNAERLGKSEVHLINVMVEGVAKLIDLERKLEAGETLNIDDIAKK